MAEDFVDFSGVNFDDTFEPEVLPKNEEAELRIISLLIDVDKNGKRYMMPFFEALSNPRVKEFGDYMPLPNGELMNEKELNKAKLRIKEFAQAFDVNLTGMVDVKQEVVGKTGWAILGIGEDQEGQPLNKIKKYVGGK